MTQFRFVAVDSSGRAKRGVMEATTEGDAVTRIEGHGFRVQDISIDLPEANGEPMGFEPKPSSAPRNQGRGMLGLILPCVLLVVALAALGVTLFKDPLGSGISKYDFSTPRAALESRMKIEMNNDVRALLELDTRVNGKKQKEQLDTLEVRKEAEYRGKKILFVAYKEDGINKYTVQSFEKDASTGYWLTSYVSAYDVEKDNKELAGQMRKWKDSGEKDMDWVADRLQGAADAQMRK